MKILFLDDDPIRHRIVERSAKNIDVEVCSVYNLNEFKQTLDNNFDIIFFDHDLKDEVGTKAVDILNEKNYSKNVLCIVHSHDYTGAQSIENKLYDTGYFAVIWPFGNELWFKKCVYKARQFKEKLNVQQTSD